MEKRENDKWLPDHDEDSSYSEDWWLDEADSADGLPVFAMDEAEDFVKDRQRLTGVPMVTGYEALERRRGVRRPRRKLSRREQRAWEKAQKYEAKLHKAQEKEDKKRAKQEAKLAAREEKAAQKQEKKEKKHKKRTKPAASSSVKSSGKKSAAKKVNSNKKSGNKEKKITAQQSIPYREMGKDGICRVEDGYYSKTIRFYDINYQLAQNEDKNAIFENWCDFLNYFDSTIHFQLSFINHHSNMAEYEDVIRIKKQNDSFDDLRMEFAQMLRNQLAKGNNGLVRTKYLTFGIEADNIREAKPKLERIETDILNNFKVLGVSAYPLNGVERLQIMYETFNQDNKVPFRFSYDDVLRTGLNTKDYIAPSSFVFKNGKDFQMGDTIGAVSYLQILAPELTDKMLAEFLEMDCNLLVNLHIQSIDQMKAIKLVKAKVTDINRMKIEEQKKAVRSGYDMDIIPSDLNTYGGEAKRLLEDLQSRNERMFLVTVVFLNTAKNKQELENVVFQTAGIAQKYNCALKRLDYQQEPGLMSSLPLGKNWIPIKRALTTTSTAIFVPFTTQELFMGGESIYYGLNALSNNLIMADRKKLKNPNGLIVGTPGAGKSFAAKREITNVFIVTKDDIIICDPEGEYFPIVRAFNGQVVRISPTSGMTRKGVTVVSEMAAAYGQKKIREDTDDNAALDATDQMELAGEGLARKSIYVRERLKENRQRNNRLRESVREEMEKSRLQFGTSASNEAKKAVQKEAEQKKQSALKKLLQKKRYQKQYQAAKQGKAAKDAVLVNAQRFTEKAKAAVKEIVAQNRNILLTIGVMVLLFALMATSLSSCAALFQGGSNAIISTSYSSEDEDIYAAENAYVALENALNEQINQMKANHSDYDEFQFQIDEIGHNPYQLISYLTVKYGGFTYAEVADEIQEIFKEQYGLYTDSTRETVTEKKKVRVGESLGQVVTSGYCNCSICCGQWSGGPTASGAYPQANHTIAVDASNPFVPMGTHVIMNGVEYVVEDTGAFARYGVQFDVYYGDHASASAHGHQTWEAYIADSDGSQEVEVTTTREVNRLDVTLTNHNLDAVLRNRMTDKEQEQYDAYNKYYGNRDYLFDINSIPTGGAGFGYDIPAEALSDPQFAKMIREAEKYLGYPYVWGGASPSTSFDCSGFVCWVINNCGNGWNVGRTTADGLRSYCSYVSPSDAKPGDLIFFQGTYDTPGASHVGIYVGNNMMIHCGNPIQYTSIASSYWQQHFMAFGRLH